MTDLDRFGTTALEAARAGGYVAAERFRTDLDVETKAGPLDPVTAVDRSAQAAVEDRIRESYPEDPVVGEESEGSTALPSEGRAWVVDPIDGTRNYVAGRRHWCTSVAVVEDGETRAAATVLPALGDAYVAGSGATRNGAPVSVSDREDPDLAAVAPIYGATDRYRSAFRGAMSHLLEAVGDARRIGSGQASLAMVAAGELDAAVTTVRLDPWDAVAGVHLVREAGGRVTDLQGDRWRADSESMVASNGAVHDRLRSVLADPGV